jgi:hypothetical protein
LITSNLEKYRELLDKLLDARKAAGGVLSIELESEFVSQLEDLWWSLSESEQETFFSRTKNSS